MSTTNSNFVLINKSATASLDGTAVTTPPYAEALDHQSALVLTGRVPGGSAANGVLGASGISNNGNFLCDEILTDLSKQGFAKNGVFHVTTTGTTPVTLDLSNLATNATTQAGDAVFATVHQISFYNVGPADMTIAPGGSNPSNIPKFTGTTPTLNIPLGSAVVVQSAAGVTIDSTHKTITITPTVGGDIVVCVGGA